MTPNTSLVPLPTTYRGWTHEWLVHDRELDRDYVCWFARGGPGRENWVCECSAERALVLPQDVVFACEHIDAARASLSSKRTLEH